MSWNKHLTKLNKVPTDINCINAEDLTACLQNFMNMGQQKEFQAVGDRALHAQLITLLRLKIEPCSARKFTARPVFSLKFSGRAARPVQGSS